MSDALMKQDLVPGDWVKMAGPGFIIYGKITMRGPDGEVNMVTSSIVNNAEIKETMEMRVEKVDQADVPPRARMWILARISQPVDESTIPDVTGAPGFMPKGQEAGR